MKKGNNETYGLNKKDIMLNFLYGKIKIKIDKLELLDSVNLFVKESGFNKQYSKEYALNRYIWTESSPLAITRVINDSTNIIQRNKSLETILASSINLK